MSDQFEMQEPGNNQQAQNGQLEAEIRNSEAESVASFHAVRCQHIKTNGTQCGSPALRDETFCYFHKHNGTREVQAVGERKMAYITLAPFEDAHSIQSALNQVARLLLEGRIEHKTASLALYALQIASSNLKQMQAEKPRPTQVVVDPEKVGETPIGMTPWTTRRDGQPELDNEEADSATIDIVHRVNERWVKEFRDCK